MRGGCLVWPIPIRQFIFAGNPCCSSNLLYRVVEYPKFISFHSEDDDYNVDFYPHDLNEIAQSVETGSHEQLAIVKRQEVGNSLSK